MNALFDDMYMKKHIGEYILFQLEQGYFLKDIKSALTRYGYKKRTVEEILKQIQVSTEPKKRSAMYSHADLDNELKIYVQSLLIDYIVKEHKLGYTLEAIRSALINYGHDAKAIDEAILIIEKGKVIDYKMPQSYMKFPQQIIGSVTLFFIFAFLVFLSIATNTSIITIIPNFFPAFVTFIVLNAVFYFLPKNKLLAALPLISILFCVGLFIGGIQYGILGKAPGSDILLILNAAVAFISCGLVCAFSKKEKEEIIVRIKDKKRPIEENLVEKRIHEPKLTEPMPKEPYHPKGKPIIPHYNKPQGNNVSNSSNNSMLHYLKEGIDNPAQKKQHAPAVEQKQQMHSHPSVQYVKKVKRDMPDQVHHLPIKRERKEKIPLKSIE